MDRFGKAYACSECKIKFSINLFEIERKKTFYVQWSQTIEHSSAVEIRKSKITGERRLRLGYELKAKGITNYISETRCFEKKFDQKQIQTFKKITSEFNHRFQISQNLIIDSEATKLDYDSCFKSENTNRINGYLQEINQLPFGLIFLSEFQHEFLPSTPLKERSIIEFDNLMEEEIIPIKDPDSLILKSRIIIVENMIEKKETEIINLSNQLSEIALRNCFLENDLGKIQNCYKSKCNELKEIMERDDQPEEKMNELIQLEKNENKKK